MLLAYLITFLNVIRYIFVIFNYNNL